MSGARKSATTPWLASAARTASAAGRRIESWAPREAGSLRGEDVERQVGQQPLEVARQLNAPGTQGGHPDRIEDRQRRGDRGQGKDRDRRQRPSGRALGRGVGAVHRRTAGRHRSPTSHRVVGCRHRDHVARARRWHRRRLDPHSGTCTCTRPPNRRQHHGAPTRCCRPHGPGPSRPSPPPHDRLPSGARCRAPGRSRS